MKKLFNVGYYSEDGSTFYSHGNSFNTLEKAQRCAAIKVAGDTDSSTWAISETTYFVEPKVPEVEFVAIT